MGFDTIFRYGGDAMNTVFIADDNTTDLAILEAVLRKLGFDVTSFANGTTIHEAICRAGKPVIALFDWMMPDRTGVEICRELITNPPPDLVYSIIVTSRAGKSDLAYALDQGADDFIAKPYDASELRARINTGFRMLEGMIEREKLLEASQRIASLESLGLIAGGIAHNFNNLMGSIYGYMDLALEVVKDDKVALYLSKAMNTIDRARGLTGQLLTFAKGGAPVLKMDHLFPFIDETVQLSLCGANVASRSDVQEGLWECHFDKSQIGQVIDNLIGNALQAIPADGTIELTARNIALAEKTHPNLAPGNYVRISVKDSGVGIPPEQLSRIFDPFFTTKPDGRGLGLATCRSIITRHEGCIDVESEPGKGSTFHVYLPASPQSVSAPPATETSAPKHTGSGTFIVMDDEEGIRETTSDMLETLGYTVVCKENGEDAIDFYVTETRAKREVAGMIFDLTIPFGMGGKEAVAEIRKLDGAIPVFVASGYADDPIMKNPAACGFTASLRKPFRKNELAAMLEKYFEKK
jgi:signal transduction histidine kinase